MKFLLSDHLNPMKNMSHTKLKFVDFLCNQPSQGDVYFQLDFV